MNFTDEVTKQVIFATLGVLDENAAVRITFTKEDGTEREMHCTLNPKLLPPREETEGDTGTSSEPEIGEVLKVWDLEKKAWRSFRWDRVTKISYTYFAK